VKVLSVVAATSIFALSIPANAASVVALTPGWYDVVEFVSSATPGSGKSCPNTAGQTYNVREYYPGPGKAGLVIIAPTLDQGLPYQTVFTFLKTTPAAGLTSFSLDATYTINTLLVPGAATTNPSDTGTASVSVTSTAVNSFAAVERVTETVITDQNLGWTGCVEVLMRMLNFSGSS
jgi:hypothetical protein